jgi:serine/threonine protein phosphatase PrpC
MNTPETPSPAAISGLRWWGLSDRGRVRKNNEDAFLGLWVDAREAHLLGKVGDASMEHADFVFAVSDGLGGQHAGEFASRTTVDKITKLLPPSYKHAAVGLDAGFSDVLTELFDQIHRALTFIGNSYEECQGMGATLSLCWFRPGWVYFGHVGDSRIYYFPKREGGYRQITHDDTYVGWLYRNGKLNEREARTHPRRTVLQKALGAGHQFVDPQVGAVGCEPGDRFLLCTDGVTDGLFDQALAELVLEPPRGTEHLDPAQRLVQTAVAQSGRDNTTAVVVELF